MKFVTNTSTSCDFLTKEKVRAAAYRRGRRRRADSVRAEPCSQQLHREADCREAICSSSGLWALGLWASERKIGKLIKLYSAHFYEFWMGSFSAVYIEADFCK